MGEEKFIILHIEIIHILKERYVCVLYIFKK